MIRRPPRSTFFPSRPPFRSGPPGSEPGPVRRCPQARARLLARPALRRPTRHRRPRPGHQEPAGRASALGPARSEEHTSELQSQSNLVCRLLLEKKKKTTRKNKLPHMTYNRLSIKTSKTI